MFLLREDGEPAETRARSQTITLEEQEGTCALPWDHLASVTHH